MTKNKKCIILTHQFLLPEDDARSYGSHSRWGDAWKVETFNFCISHFVENNPDTMIVITGHGKTPPKHILEKADKYFWSPEIIEGEIGFGHPFLVSKGLEIAKKEGVSHALKTRLDSVNLVRNIVDFCDRQLRNTNKSIITTSYSNRKYSLMDLLNYGSIDDLLSIYDYRDPRPAWCRNGTALVANNYVEKILKKDVHFPFKPKEWEAMVKEKVHVMQPSELKWIDLREHNSLLNTSRDFIINNEFEKLSKFVWKH